jgi:hypothetical protein
VDPQHDHAAVAVVIGAMHHIDSLLSKHDDGAAKLRPFAILLSRPDALY